MSIANIGKLQENTAAVRAKGLRNFAAKRQHFRSPRLISQPCKNLPSTWSDRLPWIPKNSPQSWIALVIKLLTKMKYIKEIYSRYINDQIGG